MTQREHRLLVILVVVVVGLVFGLGGHMFLYQPLIDLRSQNAADDEDLKKKQAELEKEEQQVDAILKANPRLALWKKTSLPPKDPQVKPRPGVSLEETRRRHIAHLQVEYERYLSSLLRQSGFVADSVVITPRAVEKAPGTKGKEAPLYERMVFGVTGKAKLEAVVLLMQEFHRTNLLHQIRHLGLTQPTNMTSVAAAPAGGPPGLPAGPGGRPGFGAGGPGRGRPPVDMLDVNFTVEALIVKGAEPRSVLAPSSEAVKPRVLAEPARSYTDMTARHMFNGLEPEKAAVIPLDRKEVMQFIRLTTLCYNGRRWEASLYDLAKGGEERMINDTTRREFTILDTEENPVLEGQVIDIDSRQLIFYREGKFYRLRVGEFLSPAGDTPLTKRELHEILQAAQD